MAFLLGLHDLFLVGLERRIPALEHVAALRVEAHPLRRHAGGEGDEHEQEDRHRAQHAPRARPFAHGRHHTLGRPALSRRSREVPMLNRLAPSLLVIALLAGPAAAQPAMAPRYTVGGQWAYTHRPQIKVVKLDDGNPVMTGSLASCPSCNVHYDRNLAIRKVTDAAGKPVEAAKLGFLRLGPDWKFYEFPLEVKKAWKFSAEGLVGGNPHRYDVAVLGGAPEDGETKAGAFKAHKMERPWSGASGGEPFPVTAVGWVAPRAAFP